MNEFEQLLEFEGKSAHYPKLNNLLESMYHLMTATQYSAVRKQNLYPYLLNLASFTSELLQSDFIFHAAHFVAPHVIVDTSFDSAIAKYSFLTKSQLLKISQNVIQKYYTSRSPEVISKLISNYITKKQIKHLFFPTKQEFQYKQYYDFQLDLTNTFIFLCTHLFLHQCLLESFDCYQDVVFPDFQLKELVFNAASAGNCVTFWWPAFSYEEKCVFQARYVQCQINDENDIDGDSSFLDTVRMRTQNNMQKHDQVVDQVGYYSTTQKTINQTNFNNAESIQQTYIPQQRLGPFDTQVEQTPQILNNQQQQNSSLLNNQEFYGIKCNDPLISRKTVQQDKTQVDAEQIKDLINQNTFHLKERIEQLEKQSETHKLNIQVLNQNINKLSKDFEKIFDVVTEMNKTIIQIADKQVKQQPKK